MPFHVFWSALALGLCGASTHAQDASEIPDLSSQVPDFSLDQIVPTSAVKGLIKTIGTLTSHRGYQGAASLGSPGIDIGLEITGMHLADDFTSSFTSIGSGMGSGGGEGESSGGSESSSAATAETSELPIQFLPMAKLHFHKAFGPRIDFGFSGFYFPGVTMLGYHLKLLLVDPEEGPALAFRIGYSTTTLDITKLTRKSFPLSTDGIDIGTAGVTIRSRSVTPQLIIGKKLEFAEPYLGVGMNWVSGQLDVPITITITGNTQTLSTSNVDIYQFDAFTGVTFKVPYLGFRWTLEGGYNNLGMHHLGMILGVSF